MKRITPIGMLAALALVATHGAMQRLPRFLSVEDVEAITLKTLENAPLPSPARKAAEIIAPSVVKVYGMGTLKDQDEELERGVAAILAALGKGPLVFNLGHGVLPETPPAHVERLVALIRHA